MFWLGLGLVGAGLALLGYVGWQLFGTNIVSERRQQEAVSQLEQTWSESEGATFEKNVKLGDATALLRIPRFGSDYVMPVFEGVADDVLARGYGRFEDSARAGGKGNYALAAHRVTHGEPLRDMPKLRPGDEVIVETKNHVYTYVLDTNSEQAGRDLPRHLGGGPRPSEPAARRREPGGPPPPDHAHDVCGALPHRRPDDLVRPSGREGVEVRRIR